MTNASVGARADEQWAKRGFPTRQDSVVVEQHLAKGKKSNFRAIAEHFGSYGKWINYCVDNMITTDAKQRRKMMAESEAVEKR